MGLYVPEEKNQCPTAKGRAESNMQSCVREPTGYAFRASRDVLVDIVPLK